EETSKTLQSLQSLLWRVHKSQMQPEAMEVGGVGLVHRRQVVHSDDRVPPYPRPVPAHELDGLSLAQDIDRVILLQIADQREIFDENLMRRRVPARIDDENAKARSARRPSAVRAQRLPRSGARLWRRRFLGHRSLPLPARCSRLSATLRHHQVSLAKSPVAD